MRCLSILILSYISLVSIVNAKINPCAAIDKTDTNLSNVTALFVKFKWASQVENKDGNNTITKTEMIRALERAYSEREYNRSAVLPEIMETFFKCYGSSGGLQVRSVIFENKLNSTNECVLSQKQELPNQSDFAGRIVRVIETRNFVENCGKTDVRHKAVQELVSDSSIAVTLNIALCYQQNFHPENCEKLRYLGIHGIPMGEKTNFYEILELYVDKLHSIDSNITVTSDDVDVKYSYFPSVQRNQLIWPTFISVLTVITFFLAGLILCCCGLVTFVLVEEDFQKRNEERDWIALNRRRDEQQAEAHPVSSLSSHLMTAIPNTSSHSSSSGITLSPNERRDSISTETEPLIQQDQQKKLKQRRNSIESK